MCWTSAAWQSINCSTFLCEQLFPCLLDTLLATGIRSYSKTTNLSSGPIHSSIVCGVGLATKAQNAGVTSSYAFQVSHAVLLPLPPKQDTSEGMEHRQSYTPIRTQCSGYLMSGEEPEALPNTKGNPQLQFRDV